MGARLTKNNWIEFGLRELADNGYHELKAQTLAKKLGVSRGSFYWHFEDIAEFEASVLDLWKSQAEESLKTSISQSLSPQMKLEAMLELALLPTDIERAIRSWSVSDSKVAVAVAKVDKKRFSLIEDILTDVGVEKSQIETRANLLYWAGIGRTILGNKETKSLSKSNVANLATLLAS